MRALCGWARIVLALCICGDARAGIAVILLRVPRWGLAALSQVLGIHLWRWIAINTSIRVCIGGRLLSLMCEHTIK